MKSFVAAAAVVAAVLAGGPSARAGIIAPDQPVAGMTQLQLSEAWWQTLLAIPGPTNPIGDTTGKYGYQGDRGPVFFLAGSTGGSVTRSVTVRSNQFLFFPLINGVTWAEVSAYGGGLANLQRDNREGLGIDANGAVANAALFAELNGVALPLAAGTTSLTDYRQASAATFQQFVPDPNVFGIPGPPYPATLDATSDGWWLALTPLAPGKYTLHFGGTTQSIGAYAGNTPTQDITYNLTVTSVPESASVGLVVVGAAGLAAARRRRRAG